MASFYLKFDLSRLVDFTTLNTDGADLHSLHLPSRFDAYVLQVRQPAPLVMWVIVRTQKGVIAPCLGLFAA